MVCVTKQVKNDVHYVPNFSTPKITGVLAVKPDCEQNLEAGMDDRIFDVYSCNGGE